MWGGVAIWAEIGEPDWEGVTEGGGGRWRDNIVRAERAIADMVFFLLLCLGWTRWLDGEGGTARFRLIGVLGGGSGDNTAVPKLLLLSCLAGLGSEAGSGTSCRL